MGKESKRKRRVEIIRYSRRITVVHSDETADFAADEETAADIALKVLDNAPFTLAEVNGGERAGQAAAERSFRWHFLRFFAWLRRQG